MKKSIKYIVLATAIMLLVVGCSSGVNQAEYDSVVASQTDTQVKYNQLKTDYDKLNKDYKKLNNEHEQLKEDTADWLLLSDEQKATQKAQAEADRIEAEKLAQQVKEEKAAQAAKEQEEKAAKAAEEKARKKAEEKVGYETGITFDQLARDPDSYYGKKVKFTGEVLQVSELTGEILLRLATKENSWGGYSDNVIYVYFNKTLISKRILDEDIITIYGVFQGLHSYETVLGAEITLPLVEV